MPIEKFNIKDFESALPTNKNTGKPMCEYHGLNIGEHCWIMPTSKPDVLILIRSSIGGDGWSYGLGRNSIRAYIVDPRLKSLGSKTKKYITREPGWQDRLVAMLRQLYKRSLLIKNCPKCNLPKGIYAVKKDGPNKGKLFLNCTQKCNNQFEWVKET